MMTRFLSEALKAPEPFFRHSLQKLESANGHPRTDIRLSSEVTQATRHKLRALGLDPRDTTAEELYHVLQEKVRTDDARLVKALRTQAAIHVSAEADVIAGMIQALKNLPDSKRCFALKPSALKTMIKRQPPKKAMKRLGYRSLDSFLKHETAGCLLAAAWLSEGVTWQQRLLDQYKHLGPGDFEDREITLIRPAGARWEALAAEVVASSRHNLISFKELGTIVFLPLPAAAPAGAATASLVLALHELNEIRAASTFLKLCQVRRDFGGVVRTIATDEPRLSSRLFDQAVPWNLIQRYYSHWRQTSHEAAFEPHVQLEDMAWHSIEQTLSAIEPSFDFWRNSAHLGVLERGQVVSLNLVDAALNYCNQLPFERRLVHYFRQSLWHELLLRYLRPDIVEKTIANELRPQLAEELVTV